MIHVNLGLDRLGPDGGPLDMAYQLVTPFAIIGPSNGPYPGTICLPNISLAKSAKVQPGDKGTIQIVLSAQHGAALYSVSTGPLT